MTRTIVVREAHRIDERRPGFGGPLRVCAQFAGDQSNPTYRLRMSEASYVLRRKPPGPLLKGVHAIERAAHVDAMNATLAALHSIDPHAVGLGDFGASGGYVARQLKRWSKQYLQEEAAGRHPAMDRLVEWLPLNLPDEGPAIVVHGDFPADNMIFHPSEPRVVAVLDWELSTLGEPLADFAYHAMTYRMPRDVQGGIAGMDSAAHGLPSEAEYVAADCGRTGREALPDLDYYVAFNMFRFATILHGIRGRALRGTAANAQAHRMGVLFSRVADLAWAQAEAVEQRARSH